MYPFGVFSPQVIEALADLLPRQWLEDQLIPFVAETLRSGALTTQRACLSISLLRKLRERTSPLAFLREILPAVLDVLCGCDGGLRNTSTSSGMATAQVQYGVPDVSMRPDVETDDTCCDNVKIDVVLFTKHIISCGVSSPCILRQ